MTPQERLDQLLDDVWVPTNVSVTISDIARRSIEQHNGVGSK